MNAKINRTDPNGKPNPPPAGSSVYQLFPKQVAKEKLTNGADWDIWPSLPIKSGAKTVIDFLKKLRAPPWVLSAIVPDGAITTITAHDADEVREFFTKYNGKRNLYYSVNPTWTDLSSKASKTDIAAIEYVLSDLDPRDDESSEAAKARYLSAIDKMKPQPTALVDSGNGLQVLLKLAEPIALAKPVMVLDDEGKRVKKFPPEMEDLIDDVEVRTKALMETLGGKAGTQNIDRILRLPGTINLPNAKKRKDGRVECATKLIRFNGATCSLDDFPAAAEAADDDAGDTGAKANTKTNAYHEFAQEGAPKGGDQSRSGEAFRFCCDLIRLHDDIEYKTARQHMLDDDGAVGEWAREWMRKRKNKERELKRVYNNARKRIAEESKPDEAAPATDDAPLYDPWEEYPVPPFPKGILPPELETFAEALAENMGVGVAEIAMTMLVAISGSISHQITLKLKRHGSWMASTRMWLLLSGDSSIGKTPIFNAVLEPLKNIQSENAIAYRKEMAVYKKLSPEKREQTDPPEPPPRYMVYDSTPEKLGEIIARNPKGLICKRDELAGWIIDQERYGSNSRSFYMQSADGGHYGQDRIGRKEGADIPNLSLSMIGGIQPRRLAEFEGLTSDGLLQRFIAVVLRPQNYNVDCPVPPGFEEFVRKLVERHSQSVAVHELSAEAYKLMRALDERLFDIKKVASGLAEGFSEHVGKLQGLAGNLALLLHYAYHPDDVHPRKIEGHIIEKVSRLIDEFILPHALEFYLSYARESNSGETMQKTASWILTEKIKIFVVSDLTKNVTKFRGLDLFEVNRRLSPMVAVGWIKPASPKPDNRKWVVDPRVHEQFPERTALEEKRKRELAKLMKSRRKDRGAAP